MKPKAASSNNNPYPDSDASYQPPTASTVTSKTSASHGSTATNSKRKQPSATSAAGRKIARKTAHSIIERRRRSKMNEEFGVLKDMIPACEGVEMHKLAILQAGIEYVKYLEGCVAQLKAENEKQGQVSDQDPGMSEEAHHQQSEKQNIYEQGDDDESDEDNEDEDDEMEDEPPPEYRSRVKVNYPNQANTSIANNDDWVFRDSCKASMASQTSSAYPSPFLHGQQQQQPQSDEQRRQQQKRPILPASTGSFSASPTQISINAYVTSSTPTPTMLSPAFNSIHFSPDLSRTQTNGGSSIGSTSTMNSGTLSSSTSIGSSWTPLNQAQAKPSPQMPPLPSPKASMHLPLPPLAGNLQLPHPYAAGAAGAGRENSRSPAAMSDASGTAEATATAALMMLTNDWRAGAGAGAGAVTSLSVDDGGSKGKGKGMSVRDLLSS